MKPADYKYLRFVIAAFVLLGLVGLGVYLYEPLRLRYAIYKVRDTDYSKPNRWGVGWPVADEWLMCCLQAACEGNRRAMETVIDRAGVKMSKPIESPLVYLDVTYLAAAAQPELFFAVLEGRGDKEVLKVLEAVADSAYGDSGTRLSVQGLTVPEGLIQEFEMHAKSNKPEPRGVAEAALEFTRRRFAKELVEAEAKKKRDDN